MVITTQLGIERLGRKGRPVRDRLPGSVCDAPIGEPPRCFGTGKAEALVESRSRDRLFVAGWQQHFADGKEGVLYVLPRLGPLQPLADVHLRENVGELFYDARSDTVGLLSDEARVVQPVRVADGAVLDPVPAPISPGETRYDETRGEGVFCFGPGPLRRIDGAAFLSVAFRGRPFAARPLGSAWSNPLAWASLVWGCDWDPAARRVYAANASLGLLVVLYRTRFLGHQRRLTEIPLDRPIRDARRAP